MRKPVLTLLTIVLAAAAVRGQNISPVTKIDVSALVLHLSDPLLYVGGSDKVRIFDISDGANPQLRGEYEVPETVSGLSDFGDVMVVGMDAQDEPNLHVVDISDISSPRLLFERRAGDFDKVLTDIHTVGPFIYLGVDNTILILALNEDNEPILQSQLDLSDTIREIVTVGTRAYVATDFTIDVVDVSDPSNISLINSVESLDFNNGLDIEGDIMVVAEGLEGITTYDLSNPDLPEKIDSFFIFGENETFGVDIREKFVYTALLFRPSLSIFEPARPGGLRIVDFENVNNPRLILRQINERPEENNLTAFDVIAHNGYVYVSEDFMLAVFRHGPLGTRPTSTPIIPTSTPTPTFTLTPTNTPPFLATPTGQAPQPTNTPVAPTSTPVPAVPTNTPVVPPADTPAPGTTPTATATTPPAVPTPTQGAPSGGLEPLFSSDLNGPTLGNEEFAAQLPFAGDFTLGEHRIGLIPSDNAFEGATNGRGLVASVGPGQAVTFLGPFLEIGGDYPVLLRVNVRSNGGGAQVALALIDGLDGTVSLTNPADSAVFADAYKRLALVCKAPSNNVFPLIQVASSGQQPVEVYFDNFDLIPLPPGSVMPVEAFGVGAIAP